MIRSSHLRRFMALASLRASSAAVAALCAFQTMFALAAEPAQVAPQDLSRQAGLLSTEFIYDEAPFPSCHASTIVECQGRLLAAWFGGTEERHPDVGIWLSRRDGEGWTAPVEVANGVESPAVRYPSWNPVLFQPRRGPLMLFYKVGPKPKAWWGMLQTSDNAGADWSAPVRLPPGILGPIKNKPIELANGEILCPSSSEEDGWRVHFERTADLGKTWTRTPPVNDGREIRAIQPSLLTHGASRLQAVGRTRSSGVFQVWSEDNGRTWGTMTTTGLPNPSSGTDAVTLADGRHLLVYNHNADYQGRSPLNVAISKDGRQWEAALVLENAAAGEYSYPAVIQTNDGLVHATYTWQRRKIKHVVIDPTALKTEPIVDGRWPNDVGD